METPESFNPRPRTGGDSLFVRIWNGPHKFQSAPPHGGRHHRRQRAEDQDHVSIRAPARGATSMSPIVA